MYDWEWALLALFYAAIPFQADILLTEADGIVLQILV